MNGCNLPQCMVDQRPRFEGARRRRKPRRENQVLSRSGMIRRDKRKKARYY